MYNPTPLHHSTRPCFALSFVLTEHCPLPHCPLHSAFAKTSWRLAMKAIHAIQPGAARYNSFPPLYELSG